jgi:hypothetical protein
VVLTDGTHDLVTEVTPRVACLRPAVGQQVVARGWLFYDIAHLGNRACVWEVHPVFEYAKP